MEKGGDSAAGNKPTTAQGNPNPSSDPAPPPSAEAAVPLPPPSRTPFTSLSQVDADLALARALQEQERAYAMLSMNGVESSDYESSDAGSYDYDEEGNGAGGEPDHVIGEDRGSVEGSDYGDDAFDANDPGLDSAEFENDEEFARAMQDFEEREVAVRLMALAGLSDWASDDHGDHGSNSQHAWQEIDPDEYSYEELVALGEVVGTESRGLSADTIAALPSVNYKAGIEQDGNAEQCIICRLEYEDGDSLVLLSCKHKYHSECINKWLQINKKDVKKIQQRNDTAIELEVDVGIHDTVCPVCSAEVSTSENRKD